MPKLSPTRNPKLRRSVRGYGLVSLAGVETSCGPWPDPDGPPPPETLRKYHELVGQWNAQGRRVPVRPTRAPLSVADLAQRFAEHAGKTYRKRGQPTSYALMVGRVMAVLSRLYGTTEATGFGMAEFRTVRDHWVRTPNAFGRLRCRRGVNEYAEIVRRAFWWAAGEGLIPPPTWADPHIVPRLRKGRTDAAESDPVRPVPATALEEVRRAIRPEVMAMIDLQMLTAMRPGEVCGMRPCDLDREEPIWTYRVPAQVNKTFHVGRDRNVQLGPRAQAILRPYLERTPRLDMPVFRTARGKVFTPKSYAAAIGHQCRRQRVERWGPGRLRHNALTAIRQRYGVEAARLVAGHSDLKTTEIYAEMDQSVTTRIAGEMG